MLKKTIFTFIILIIIGILHYNFPNSLGDSHNKAYLILYTVILLSYVLNLRKAAIFKSFNFQYAIIWILLSMVLIIGYSFKQQLQNELLPSRPQILADNSFMVKTSLDGHYHIEVKMNGKKTNCLIDTGATNISIDEELANSIGIDASKLSYSNPTQTANGVIYSAKANLSLFEIAGATINDINVTVNNSEMNGCLLGLSFLNTMSKINIENGVMTLTPKN